jgi:hypothetical protein
MKFIQQKDGSCDIEFSWKEKLIILRKGKLHLSDEGLRHFGNVLLRIIAEWNVNFNDKIKNIQTTNDTTLNGS